MLDLQYMTNTKDGAEAIKSKKESESRLQTKVRADT